MEQVAADPMVLADFGTTQPRKIRFGLVDVRAVLGLVFDTVIDAAHVVGRVQALPGVRFVGTYDRTGSDVLADQWNRLTLARHNERPGATVHFADDNHDL